MLVLLFTYLYLFLLIGLGIFGFSRISSDFYITSTRVLMNLYDLLQLIWCWLYFWYFFTYSCSFSLASLNFHASLHTLTLHVLEFWWIFTIHYNKYDAGLTFYISLLIATDWTWYFWFFTPCFHASFNECKTSRALYFRCKVKPEFLLDISGLLYPFQFLSLF